MDIQGNFTAKGLALSAGLATGATLTITRVVAGSGHTENPSTAASLSMPRQTLAVNTPTRSGNTTTVPVTLAASLAPEDYTLTELGIYAQDPLEGEILYKIYRLTEPVDVSVRSRMVLRFYLTETVTEDADMTVVCFPAGLLTEADLAPVRATQVPTREVVLSASALPAFLAALPRLITERLVIHVSGPLTEPVYLNNFYGSGSIWICGDTLGNCTISNAMTISDCSVFVMLQALAFVCSDAIAATDYQAAISVLNARQVGIDGCAFTGSGAERAVIATNTSSAWVNDCRIQGFDVAVASWGYSILGVCNVEASDNITGIHTYHGGIALLTGTTSPLVGGVANYNVEGLIVSGGSLL